MQRWFDRSHGFNSKCVVNRQFPIRGQLHGSQIQKSGSISIQKQEIRSTDIAEREEMRAGQRFMSYFVKVWEPFGTHDLVIELVEPILAVPYHGEGIYTF